jgi:5-hydroxyisourate hydrolase
LAGKLTTHVLDTELGRAGAGMRVEVYRCEPAPEKLLSLVLDGDGRGTLLEGAALRKGVYELVFFVGDYHRERGAAVETPFLDAVPVRFGIADPNAQYHVPLVLSRHGYTTYRGG